MDESPLTPEELETLKSLLSKLIDLSLRAGHRHPLTEHAEMTYAYVKALSDQTPI